MLTTLLPTEKRLHGWHLSQHHWTYKDSLTICVHTWLPSIFNKIFSKVCFISEAAPKLTSLCKELPLRIRKEPLRQTWLACSCPLISSKTHKSADQSVTGKKKTITKKHSGITLTLKTGSFFPSVVCRFFTLLLPKVSIFLHRCRLLCIAQPLMLWHCHVCMMLHVTVFWYGGSLNETKL